MSNRNSNIVIFNANRIRFGAVFMAGTVFGFALSLFCVFA